MWCETRRARRLSAPRWGWVPWLRTSENEGRRKQTAREKQIRKGQHKHERENSETQWCVSVRASDRSVRVLSSWVSWRCVCVWNEGGKEKEKEKRVWGMNVRFTGSRRVLWPLGRAYCDGKGLVFLFCAPLDGWCGAVQVWKEECVQWDFLWLW